MSESSCLDLKDYIRSVPDFPKPGILFRDITPLLSSPEAFGKAVQMMADHFSDRKIDAIAAAEARGFLFAAPLALKLNTALVPIRKPGKLPYKTLSYSYDLEYGSDLLQIHTDAVSDGAHVLIVDDLLATGGTVDACCKLIEKAGGKIVACAFLIELSDLAGRKKISQYEVMSLIKYNE